MDECLSECTTRHFTVLEVRGKRAVLDWCVNLGLISSSYECPKCFESMRLGERKSSIDGYEWRCKKKGNNPHEVTRSVRAGSWFSSSHLSICDILRVTRLWFGRCMNEFVMNEVKVSSHAVVDWFTLCREVCVIDVIENSTRLGGPGVTVEIDVSKFEKLKCVRAGPMNGEWVFVGVETGSNRCFARVVTDRTEDQMIAVIREWVLPGSTIVSDYWKSFDCLSTEGFVDLRINRDITFKDNDSGTNTFESIWSAKKRFHKNTTNHVLGEFDSYLFEYMWRKMHDHSMKDDTFLQFIQAIIRIYKPYEKDVSTTTAKKIRYSSIS